MNTPTATASQTRRRGSVAVAGLSIPADPAVTRLLGYFRDRELYQRRELETFNQQKLIQFREDRRAFSEERYESLFDQNSCGRALFLGLKTLGGVV